VNCRDALRLLYDVVDNEANEDEISQVQEHLKKCRHCSARYELEMKFKNCIEKKGAFSPECADLQKRILDQLDTVDDTAAGEVGPSPFPFKWIAVSLAAAAAIIVCLVAASALDNFYHVQKDIVPFTKVHMASLAQSHTDMAPSEAFEFLYEHTGIRLELPPELNPDDIHSVMIDTIKGIPFGCIQVAGQGDEIVSIFIASKDAYTLPDSPCEIIRGSKMLVSGCRHCNLVGCEKRGLVFLAVSRDVYKPEQLAEFTSYF
jgi:anti-sigma factor (TIGR02949 family)